MTPVHHRTHGLALVLMLVLPLAGCATWRPAGMPVEQVLREPDPPGRVVVHLRDGTQFLLTDPSVHADTLMGRRYPHGADSGNPEPGTKVGVALADVESVEIGKVNVVKTATFVIFVAAAMVFVYGARDGFGVWD